MASYQRPSSAAGLVGQSKPPQVNGWEVEGSKTAVRSHSAMRQQVSFSPYVQAYSQAQMDAAQQQAAAAQRPQSAMTYRASKSKKWKRHYGPQFEYTLEYEEDTQGKKQKAKVQPKNPVMDRVQRHASTSNNSIVWWSVPAWCR